MNWYDQDIFAFNETMPFSVDKAGQPHFQANFLAGPYAVFSVSVARQFAPTRVEFNAVALSFRGKVLVHPYLGALEEEIAAGTEVDVMLLDECYASECAHLYHFETKRMIQLYSWESAPSAVSIACRRGD